MEGLCAARCVGAGGVVRVGPRLKSPSEGLGRGQNEAPPKILSEGAGGVVRVERGSSLCQDVQIVAAVIYLWFAGFSFCLASASFPVLLHIILLHIILLFPVYYTDSCQSL